MEALKRLEELALEVTMLADEVGELPPFLSAWVDGADLVVKLLPEWRELSCRRS